MFMAFGIQGKFPGDRIKPFIFENNPEDDQSIESNN